MSAHRIQVAPLSELTSLEAFELFKLRVDVFVAEQRCPYRELDEQDTHPDTLHLLAWNGAVLEGCARVFPTATGSQFGRFVVAPAARGTGLGAQIARTGIELTERWPGDLIVEAQSGLVPYYEQFGLVAEGEEFLDTGVPHRVMRLRRS